MRLGLYPFIVSIIFGLEEIGKFSEGDTTAPVPRMCHHWLNGSTKVVTKSVFYGIAILNCLTSQIDVICIDCTRPAGQMNLVVVNFSNMGEKTLSWQVTNQQILQHIKHISTKGISLKR